jgi:electron transport complex protein RnfB
MIPLAENFFFQLLAGSLLLGSLLLAIAWSVIATRKRLQEQRFLVDRINSILPQTQCGRCGHPGCRPYARAIATGEAINRCPPGGDSTIRRLALLLNEARVPLDPAHGEIEPARVAVIREAECIGCTKCIVACPVDAIIGAAKRMHTVIASECTGCDLCIEPCPVDCIDLVERDAAPRYWSLSGFASPAATANREALDGEPCHD